ncbi:FHA domain-containing protein [Streptomyces iranensis]|uniref:ABC-type multidrug transport system ATPase subunit n=1 Tax=Streptomyces iranensis TaxID=576784 RepID=A0A061A6P3_9ACTN|nr:FHA domain-containing protein [Streptomyces iranensis]MBP2060202.1 ABC-type multidrug transport system ATPase subunit [Streptomyces iranensis]CDR13647.1 FHA modulated ABC efflux pump with fused ATPaseand integral membrane subunits [Streptomyces iranensis]
MPELVLHANGRTWTLDPSRSYTIGRDQQADISCIDRRVSRRHLVIRCDGGTWFIEDLGSANGTFAEGRRIQRMEIGHGSIVRLGNVSTGMRLDFTGVFTGASAAAGDDQVRADARIRAGLPQGEARPKAGGATDRGTPEAAAATPPVVPGPRAGEVPGAPTGAAAHGDGLFRPLPHHAASDPTRAAVPRTSGAAGDARDARRPEGPTAGPRGAAAALSIDRDPSGVHRLALGQRLRIGRGQDNELVVEGPYVSRHHAEFRPLPGGRFEIVDLGSHNGTYVNGQPVHRRVIGPHDIVGVGHSTFRLAGDRLEEFVDTGEVSFTARNLTVTVGRDKTILDDVSFGVPEKSLVAVIGPSGSGKSTLLRALTGYRPADRGQVLYDHRDLYAQFAELRRRIGLVPQDDILHKELTVDTALKYAAKLRFPGDTKAAERKARIDEVLQELRLDVHRTKKVASLSGGQRKRVSVALELLTKPSLLFLDEPTSGLDPGLDRSVMKLLRELADDGRTVLVVTHSVAELSMCDRVLVMAPGGSAAYFGPPDEALDFFGHDSWADVFSAFEDHHDDDWGGRWRASRQYDRCMAEIDSAVPPQQPGTPAAQPRARALQPKPQGWIGQLWTLMRRYVSVIASDKGFMALMLLLPAVLGGVSCLIPAKYGLAPPPPDSGFRYNQESGTILLVLVVGMCFSGAANSVRELIKERVIYERERATGLSRSAYLMSKVVVLGLITAMQGVVICAIGFSVRQLPGQGLLMPTAVEVCVVVSALGFTTMLFGLVISALVRTPEKTMPLLVMFAVIQVVFTGVLFKLFDSPGIEQIGWLMPARWGVAGAGTTLDLAHTMPPWNLDKPDDLDPLWAHTVTQWGIDLGVLLAIGLLCGFAVARLLRRHEPEIMRD